MGDYRIKRPYGPVSMEGDYRHKSMHVHCFLIYLSPNITLSIIIMLSCMYLLCILIHPSPYLLLTFNRLLYCYLYSYSS